MNEQKLLLDSSVVVDLFVPPAHATIARDWLREEDSNLLISDLAVGEYNSAIARLRRMGVLDHGKAELLFAMFDGWRAANATPVTTEPTDIRTAGSNLRLPDVNLRMPDAIHIATAQRLGAVLATFDVKQAVAARRLGVNVLSFAN